MLAWVLAVALTARGQTASDLYRLGNMKFDVGDYSSAIDLYTRSLAIDRYNAGVYFNRGLVYYNLLQYELAGQDFTRVINMNPNDTKAYILRGFCRHHLGDLAGACIDWDHAGGQQCYDACGIIDEYCH